MDISGSVSLKSAELIVGTRLEGSPSGDSRRVLSTKDMITSTLVIANGYNLFQVL